MRDKVRCPICGGHCACKNRGADGTCCACHKHKARPMKAIVPSTPEQHAAFKRHEQALEQSGKRFQRTFEFKQQE